MAISSATTTKIYHPGAAMAPEALTGIAFLDPDELVVEHWAAGAIAATSILARDAHYTIGGNGATAAGTITALQTYPAGDELRIYRRAPALQPEVLPKFGPMKAKDLERGLDRLALRVQELDRDLGRAILGGQWEGDFELPAPTFRRNKVLHFDRVTGAPSYLDAQQWADEAAFVSTEIAGSAVLSTRALLRGVLLPILGQAVILHEGGRHGIFVWTSGNLSAAVAADPREGVYIAPSWRPDGTLGAWVRRYEGPLCVTWFGAVGDGVADCSGAFSAARDLAVYLGYRELTVPAGRWRLTQPNSMGSRDAAASGVTQGFTWRGAGMRVTEIFYDNPTGYLVRNDNDQQFVNYVGFSFDGDSVSRTSRFMYMTSGSGGSNAQSIRFTDCRWRYWETILLGEGSTMVSEMLYIGCKAQAIYGKAFIIDNIQSLNHNYFGCDFEVMYDSVWFFKRGGALNVYGGSIILDNPAGGTNPGAVLQTDDTTGAGIGLNNWNYNFHGIRTELKGTSMLLQSNSHGFVHFDSCNFEVILGDTSRVLMSIFDGMKVLATSCSLDGKVLLRAENTSSFAKALRPATLTARDCHLGASFVVERQAVANVGGQGKAIIDNCKRSTLPSGGNEPLDQMIGWRDGTQGYSMPRRIAIVRNPNRTSGLPHSTAGIQLRLPLDAVIRSARLIHPAQAGPAGQRYHLYNGDRTQILATWTFDIATAQNALIELNHDCSDDNQRTLFFAIDAGNVASAYNGWLEVEYIA